MVWPAARRTALVSVLGALAFSCTGGDGAAPHEPVVSAPGVGGSGVLPGGAGGSLGSGGSAGAVASGSGGGPGTGTGVAGPPLIDAGGGTGGGAPDASVADAALPVDRCAADRIGDHEVSDPATGNSYEPTLAASPSGSVVASYFTYPDALGNATEIGYRVSRDFGATWGDVQRIASPRTQHAADPVLGFDAADNFYLGFVANQTSGDGDGWIYVAKLAAGASAFATPVLASSDATAERDKPWLFVDNANNVFAGHVLGANNRWQMLLDKSTDGGASFTESTIIGGFTDVQLGAMCQDPAGGPDAPLYFVYFRNAAGFTINARRSTDGGATWSAEVPAATQGVSYTDPTCVASGQDLWIAYGTTALPDESSLGRQSDAGVKVVHSGDGGLSFDAPVNVSDGMPSYMLPRIAAGGDRLYIGYYQGPYGVPGAQLKLASSSDNGASWAPEVMVSQVGTLTDQRQSLTFMGDYFGLAAPAGWIFAGTIDNTTNPNTIQVVSRCAR